MLPSGLLGQAMSDGAKSLIGKEVLVKLSGRRVRRAKVIEVDVTSDNPLRLEVYEADGKSSQGWTSAERVRVFYSEAAHKELEQKLAGKVEAEKVHEAKKKAEAAEKAKKAAELMKIAHEKMPAGVKAKDVEFFTIEEVGAGDVAVHLKDGDAAVLGTVTGFADEDEAGEWVSHAIPAASDTNDLDELEDEGEEESDDEGENEDDE